MLFTAISLLGLAAYSTAAPLAAPETGLAERGVVYVPGAQRRSLGGFNDFQRGFGHDRNKFGGSWHSNFDDIFRYRDDDFFFDKHGRGRGFDRSRQHDNFFLIEHKRQQDKKFDFDFDRRRKDDHFFAQDLHKYVRNVDFGRRFQDNIRRNHFRKQYNDHNNVVVVVVTKVIQIIQGGGHHERYLVDNFPIDPKFSGKSPRFVCLTDHNVVTVDAGRNSVLPAIGAPEATGGFVATGVANTISPTAGLIATSTAAVEGQVEELPQAEEPVAEVVDEEQVEGEGEEQVEGEGEEQIEGEEQVEGEGEEQVEEPVAEEEQVEGEGEVEEPVATEGEGEAEAPAVRRRQAAADEIAELQTQEVEVEGETDFSIDNLGKTMLLPQGVAPPTWANAEVVEDPALILDNDQSIGIQTV